VNFDFLTDEDLQAIDQVGWRSSPLATATRLAAETSEDYARPMHLVMLSDAIVEAVETGGRVIVTMPPRHGKSHLTSNFTPLWFLENYPDKYVINCGYGAEFASEWGAKVRDMIKDFQHLLSFNLKNDSKAANKWKTDKGGGMTTAGIGGGVTGRGAHLMLIDDPIKNAKEADSWQYREDLWKWYTSAARTRLEPGGALIVVQTRWNEDDLAGRLIRRADEPWKVINFPAIYDEKAAALGPCPLGRKIGDPLWPERYSIEALKVFMRTDAMVWESLFQQRPGATAGLGNVYSSFNSVRNSSRTVTRDPFLPLIWSLDFNRDPFCTVIGQYIERFGPMSHLTNEKHAFVEIIDELCLSDAGTEEMCEAFYARVQEICGNQQRITLEIYGDPAAQSKHTSQVVGSDYDIIRNFFRNKKQFEVRMNIARKAPAIKDRVNCFNGMLLNALKEVRMVIDPRCKMLIRDLESVRWKLDLNGNTTGQLNKAQKDLTHISDACGYFLHRRFGNKTQSGEQAGLMQ